jgi:hypothetical protein
MEQPVNGSVTSARNSTSVLTPVLISGVSLRPGADWYKICVSEEDRKPGDPIVDLALAGVTTGPKGELQRAEVLAALNPGYGAWVLEFLKHLHFVPRRRDGVPEPGSTLVLVRGVVDTDRIHSSPFPPAASLWVAEYARASTGLEIPLVNVVLLEPPLPEKPLVHPNGLQQDSSSSSACVQYYGQGSEWSVNVRRAVASSPGIPEPNARPGTW